MGLYAFDKSFKRLFKKGGLLRSKSFKQFKRKWDLRCFYELRPWELMIEPVRYWLYCRKHGI